jgi:hypothetical protein
MVLNWYAPTNAQLEIILIFYINCALVDAYLFQKKMRCLNNIKTIYGYMNPIYSTFFLIYNFRWPALFIFIVTYFCCEFDLYFRIRLIESPLLVFCLSHRLELWPIGLIHVSVGDVREIQAFIYKFETDIFSFQISKLFLT